MFEYTRFGGHLIQEVLNEISIFTRPIIHEVIYFFALLPPIVQSTFRILLLFAVVGILMSHIKGIIKNMGEWKKHPRSKLMFGYFFGSGTVQRKLIYKDAHIFLRDRKWSWLSIAGLAYRLGIFAHPSKLLMFVCSLVYLPAVILGFFEMTLRVIIGTVYLLATSIAHWLVLSVLQPLSYLLIPFWQIADKLARINQHCPDCYETFNLPEFRCPRCEEIHKALIPSVCGIMVARCACGNFLASSVHTGRSQIDAVCPACKTELAAANAKQFSIQLVGGNTSGKTAYLAAFQHLYLDRLINKDRRLSVYGKPQDYFDDLEEIYKSGQTQQSSSAAVLTYSFLHKVKRTGKYNLVIYDIPDEVLLNNSYIRNPRNLGFTNGIIIIVDPLAVPSVRNECIKVGIGNEVNNYSTDDISELIIEFVHQFSSITGLSARKQITVPVAIVINKADVKVIKREIGLPKIKATFNANPGAFGYDITVARDKLCRVYLEKLGLDNALNNIDSIFSHIRYFPVSAMGHASKKGKEFEPFGVIAPIAWITKEARAELYNYVRWAMTEES